MVRMLGHIEERRCDVRALLLIQLFLVFVAEFPVSEDDLALRIYYAWGLGEVKRDGVRMLYGKCRDIDASFLPFRSR